MSLSRPPRFSRTLFGPGGYLFAALLVSAIILQACSGPGLAVRHVPEDGFESTLNYQVQAQVHSDSQGRCQMMVVRVRALNKIYSDGEPPPRLRLFDDDCARPLRFERVQYISTETGEQVFLTGSQVSRFFGRYVQLENEVIEWLWRAGVI